MRKILATLFFFTCFTTGYSKNWIMGDDKIEVQFNDVTTLITVKDKRCNKIWHQSANKDSLTIQKTIQNGNVLSIHFIGKYKFTVLLELTKQSELAISISANVDMPIDEIKFPAAFHLSSNHYIVLTDGEGMLLPVDDKQYPEGSGITYYCGGGTSMAWMGVTDKNLKTGYMALLQTPYDAALRTKRVGGSLGFETVWLASKEKFGYTRKVVFVFFDKGGYVAQCKRYRKEVWATNHIVSLKDKIKKTPAIDKMMGAAHIYVWDNARNAAFSKELKEAGIDKAMFIWNPNHQPYTSKGYNDSLKAMGYAVGSYELFTDENLRDTNYYDLSKSETFLKRNAYPGMFNQLVARKKDGTTYSNQFGHYTNPKAMLPQIVKRTGKEMAIWNHETYFLDVYQANGLYECWSIENPLTRKEWAENILLGQQYMINKYNFFLGGEWGADFANANITYAHGMMTLQRTWFGSEVNKKGTIYYGGDWKNGQRPTQMLGIRTAPPKYMQYSINENLRVPLYELVYHDAVVTSWRWEDANHHNPEIWWKKDLFNILYGSAPLWTIDRETWTAFKNTFIESYKNICPWLQKIGYDEMVSHRFITADHKVQESSFSSGKKVVVNFGDDEFEMDGRKIKARGFIVLE